MGKNRRSSSSNYPVGGDLNQIVDNQATVQPTRDDKIKDELNELYGEIYEVEMNRSTAWGAYYSSQDKINALKDQLAAIPNKNGTQAKEIQRQIDKKQVEADGHKEIAMQEQKKLEEMNKRIHTLETGFDTGDTSSVIDMLESGENDDEL